MQNDIAYQSQYHQQMRNVYIAFSHITHPTLIVYHHRLLLTRLLIPIHSSIRIIESRSALSASASRDKLGTAWRPDRYLHIDSTT